MKKLLLTAVAIAVLAACQPAATTSATADTATTSTVREAISSVAPNAPYIVAALADTHRTDAERARDAPRHAAETLALAEVAPGQKVGELLPGEGYFTRLLSGAVGPQGRVYAISRAASDQYEHSVLKDVANVTNITAPYDHFTIPEPVDLIFTAQNYHDFKIAQYHMGSTIDVDRAAFAALKPGGIYFIIDHSAVAGSSENQEHPLHRIDQDVVRREVESVGFVYDGESQMLRNPADPRTAVVFDPSIHGHTDQFVMRFRKPS